MIFVNIASLTGQFICGILCCTCWIYYR